jgi:hypothetical protein
MGVGIPTGSVVRDNTGCIMGHALGVHVVDINGNTFFEGPLAAPQVGLGSLLPWLQRRAVLERSVYFAKVYSVAHSCGLASQSI